MLDFVPNVGRLVSFGTNYGIWDDPNQLYECGFVR